MILKKKKTFPLCIAASVLFHLTALFVLQSYGLWISSEGESKTATWLDQADKAELDQILQVAFDRAPSDLPTIKTPKQLDPESISPIKPAPSFHIQEFESSPITFAQPQFPMDNLLFVNHILPTFSMPSAPFDLLDHLPRDLTLPEPPKIEEKEIFPSPAKAMLTLASNVPIVNQSIENAPHFTEKRPLSALTTTKLTPKIAAGLPSIHLPKLPSLDDLKTSSHSDSFDTDLVFVETEEGKYIFALTLMPKPTLNLETMKQHFVFLIDKANSIQQERLTATKSAIRKALQELSSEDTFNIIAFDSKMEKMAPHSTSNTKQGLSKAESFLDKIHLGSFFATSDLSKPLFLTVPSSVPDNELYTAILLTDAETLAKRNAQKSLLDDWTDYNNGKVNLYAVGMNYDNHTSLLETATVLNKGKSIFSSTNRGLKRKLLKLMRTLRAPVAKNMTCIAINSSPNANILLAPFDAPNLYLEQPFVVMGQADTLDDFILFVQGKSKDRWLNIKKKISFTHAKKGSKSLKQEWALQCAFKLYHSYTLDNNPEHIAEAQNLLEPFNLHIPYR